VTSPPPPVPQPSPPKGGASNYRHRVNRRDFRFIFPEFLPDPDSRYRNHTVERLARKDMVRRRNMVELPEFYPGSIVAVTVSDPNAPNQNKTSRFVGLVIARGGSHLNAWAIVRNAIDGQGVEFMYYLYSPAVQKVETLRLEKRLDDELYYLRDAPLEYSTFPSDMDMEILPEGVPVPVNEIVVPLKPKPWARKWDFAHLSNRLVGFSYDPADAFGKRRNHVEAEKFMSYLYPGWHFQVAKYDLILQYMETVTIEEQVSRWGKGKRPRRIQ
jgi:large subunit ribosomal protein L19